MTRTPPPAAQGNRGKFIDPTLTATGEPRAQVTLDGLRTLWLNTGSLCNIACENCYIESSPRNDRLAYLSLAEAVAFFDEAKTCAPELVEIGFTGGEPFLNPEFPEMLTVALERGYRALVLTNAMKPMHHHRADLLALRQRFAKSLALRISVDHYDANKHELVRGIGSWSPMLEGLRWLCANGFCVHVAGRTLWGEPEDAVRNGFARLFTAEKLPLDASDPRALVLFPEMDLRAEVPEITARCWDILGVTPRQMMCASARMVIKRKGDDRPVVVPCTLLPYDRRFDLGAGLATSTRTVALNHPFCAQFCVLGGATCSVP
ncbi:MAG: radical SAM protein [Rhodospirillales bacterium]|nr:radical SAM protein [Rhodospirillales bacterium]